MTSTLRDLPLPAKLTLSAFLLAVGLGYFSALVQLHLRHSSQNGEPLPSAADVVSVFAGVERFDPAKPMVCRLEKLVMGPRDKFNGGVSMAGAFFERDCGDYNREIKDDPTAKPKLDAERENERLCMQAWIRLPKAERITAYDADSMPRPAGMTMLTAEFVAGDAVKVKSMLDVRCVRCHGKDMAEEKYPLETYAQIAKYLPQVENPAPGSWVPNGRQMSIDKLTQSTHAHLLSFAMLFGLTGFAFAFTSYPRGMRLVLAPMVLVAQVLDVSCWWLARIDGVGPYFATAILGTGTVVGVGLCVQILGCLWDMYERRGKIILIAMMVLIGLGFTVLYTKAIAPALNAEKMKS